MINLLQKITKKKILLPFYHAIADKPLPHIKHLYRMRTTAEFQKDLDFLLKHFLPIDAETLYHFHTHKVVPKKAVFHLTFDDGLKEMYEIVAPILLKKGIPATFFVNSGFVDNKALMYRYHASLAVENLLQEKKLTNDLKSEILSCSYSEKEKLLQHFSQQQVDDFLNTEKPYLTSKQIQALHNQGFSIGAHSIDHPYYYEIPLEEQLRQTRKSLEFVSACVNQKLRLFAFPFTDFQVSRAFFEAIKSDVDLSFGTANLKNDEISFNIQRIPAETASYRSLKTIVQSQYLKYAIKRVFGKNKIKR